MMTKSKGKASLTTRSFQRAMHQSNILDLIRTSELISRTELAQQTGLSQASVTGITAGLIEKNLIEERKTGVSEGGRRPILLAIRPDGVHAIGVNMAIDQIRVVIVNFLAELKVSHSVILKREHYEPEEIIEIIFQAIQACMWESNFSKDEIAGVGVGIPGPVDAVSGVVRFLPNYDWKEVPFRDMLREKINHPVFIDNSSNNLAIAQYWYGTGRGMDNFLVITLENGVGAGTVLNGQLVRGHLGIAGEFGHLCADTEGPVCRCGRRGCIESFVGNNSIVQAARVLVQKGIWSSSETLPEELTFNDVLAELKHGNRELEKFYMKAGEVLGVGIYNLITLLNPELVIITGKGVQAGEPLFEHMFQALDRLKAGRFSFTQTEIVIQTWTDGDWARESGTLVLREIYKSPTVR